MLHNRRSLMALFGAALLTPIAVSAAAQVNPNWNGLVWSKERALFVSVGSNGVRVKISHDGKQWKSL